MKRFNHWLERRGIHYIAGFFLVVLVSTSAISCSPQEVPQPGTQHVDPEPLLYDLSLGILAAYMFNHLVVVLPAKRREGSRLRSLYKPLMTITNNGVDLIRELERIGRCPHNRITEEHLTKVLAAVPNNLAVRHHILKRFIEAEQAYQDIVPYAADLPLDLQEILQRENQSLMHVAFISQLGIQPSSPPSLYSLRKKSNLSLFPYVGMLLEYYRTTEAIRYTLHKHMPILRFQSAKAMNSIRRSQTFDLDRRREYPYMSYPEPEATSEPVEEPASEEPKPVEVCLQ